MAPQLMNPSNEDLPSASAFGNASRSEFGEYRELSSFASQEEASSTSPPFSADVPLSVWESFSHEDSYHQFWFPRSKSHLDRMYASSSMPPPDPTNRVFERLRKSIERTSPVHRLQSKKACELGIPADVLKGKFQLNNPETTLWFPTAEFKALQSCGRKKDNWVN